MGADFIEKAARTFRKSWDAGLVALGTADLFTQQPTCAARTSAAEIVDNAVFRTGDKVVVEKDSRGLVARRGLTEVARFSNPSTELIRAVESSCGVAKGTVEQVHALAGVVEISLC